jgi:transposase
MPFNRYDQQRLQLLPPSLEELIPAGDPVRVFNAVVDRLKLGAIEKSYKKTGCSAYHPRMMIKLIIYAYLRNTYSSRRIEDFVANDVRFMWLSGMQRPDHNTINLFGSSKLNGTLKEIFAQIVRMMVDEGLVSLERVYTDGTKIESAVGRYTFVWGKSVRRKSEKIASQINELWEYARSVADTELRDHTPVTAREVTSETIEGVPASQSPAYPTVTAREVTSETIEGLVGDIQAALDGKPADRNVKAKLTRVKRDWKAQLDQARSDASAIGHRGSMSRTDPEATFMRMKEDHMGNGQLKPGYNTQIRTINGVITNYTMHQTPGDTTTYKEHLQEHKRLYGEYPSESIADAGYGSEENFHFAEDNGITPYVKYNYFHFAEDNGITPYVKYNYFHMEQKNSRKANPFIVDNLHYDPKRDCFYCPMGQPRKRTGERRHATSTGYMQTLTLYAARRCAGCPLRGACHKGVGERVIQVNHNLPALPLRQE